MDLRSMIADVRRCGLTQAEVAKAIGTTQGSISKIERGVTKELRSGAYVKLVALYQSKVSGATAKSVIVAPVAVTNTADGVCNALAHEVAPCR